MAGFVKGSRDVPKAARSRHPCAQVCSVSKVQLVQLIGVLWYYTDLHGESAPAQV